MLKKAEGRREREKVEGRREREKAEGRGQKGKLWYQVVVADRL
jgi:hypothetical protein